MSKFIEITLQPKPVGTQGYPASTITVSADAILAFRPSVDNVFNITLKPEYETRIRQALGLHPQQELSSVTAPKKTVETLL